MANIKTIKYLTQDELKNLLKVIGTIKPITKKPTLTKREKLIIDLSLGLNGKQRYTMSQIAKELGVSRQAISYSKIQAMKKLKGKYITEAEIQGKRDKAIFLIAYRHGLRACEVGMLRLEDVDLPRGRIRIVRAKNSQGGEYPMQGDEIKTLKAWLRVRKDNNPFLFPSRRGLPISRRTLDYMMKDYGEKASIPVDKRHFHVLKHSIATHLLDAGAELRFVQDWIGHKNIQNTVVYTHFSHRTQDEMARKFFASPMIVGA